MKTTQTLCELTQAAIHAFFNNEKSLVQEYSQHQLLNLAYYHYCKTNNQQFTIINSFQKEIHVLRNHNLKNWNLSHEEQIDVLKKSLKSMKLSDIIAHWKQCKLISNEKDEKAISNILFKTDILKTGSHNLMNLYNEVKLFLKKDEQILQEIKENKSLMTDDNTMRVKERNFIMNIVHEISLLNKSKKPSILLGAFINKYVENGSMTNEQQNHMEDKIKWILLGKHQESTTSLDSITQYFSSDELINRFHNYLYNV